MAATTVGVPLMGIAFVHFEHNMITLKLSIYFVLTFILASAIFYYFKLTGWQIVAPLIGLGSAVYGVSSKFLRSIQNLIFFFQSVTTSQYMGVVGAALYVISGVVIGTEGKIGSFKRVDLFHYGLVVSNLLLALGLQGVLAVYSLRLL